MTVVGLDRARGRWAAVALSETGGIEIDVLGSASQVTDRWPDAAAVGVDIPIGLPVDAIGRPVDAEARRLLGRRGSSVFPALPEELYRMDYPDALAVARERLGTGFSKQAWNLGPAVLDVAVVAGSHWFEVHPELAFERMAGGQVPSKKTWSGLRVRLDLLAESGVQVPAGRMDVPPDDVLDAAICARVASLVLTGDARRIGPPESGPIWF